MQETYKPNEHGTDLTYKGVKLIIFQSISGELKEPVIIEN